MVAITTIRRIEVSATSNGVTETTAKLDALSRAQTTVATTADGMAVKTESSSRRQLSAAGAYDRLRSTIDDSFKASQRLASGQAIIDRAYQQGVISVDEQSRAMQQLQARYAGAATANDNLGKAVSGSMGLARHEMINLSRQAQDVAVSLAGGQSPLTVLFQQGSQIGDVFATSQGTVSGFIKQITGSLGSVLTVGRVAFGGLALAITGAGLALSSYLDSQQKVQLALTGAGRASGATAASINAAASAGATGGLSVSSARDLATTLVATGKIGVDSLTPILKLGHDFATTFGVDATEAAKMLAQAFADPVKGAEQLNERLGFLDAAMQRQIASLVAQNRMYEAQQALLTAVQGSLAKTAEVTGFWSQMWTGLKNGASNFFDFVGEKLANGLGLNKSLQEQAEQLKAGIASYESGWGRIFGSSADLEVLKRQLADVNALIEKRASATQNAAAAQASLRQQSVVMGQLPEIGQRQSLSDQASVAGAVAEDPVAQRALGITQAQADRVRAILGQVKADYKTTFEEIQQNAKIAQDAVTAFSPAAKALIAARQATEQYRASGGVDPTEKAKIAQDAYNLSLKQSVTALSEAGRARELSANQAVQSSQLEADIVGKTIGQQAELRANLQARQTLEQQASQNRTAFDEAEYARLKKINEELGRRQQMAAVRQLSSDISFDRSQIGLNDNEQAANSRLRSIYGDDVNSTQAEFYRQQLLVNSSLREMNDAGKDAAKGFASDFRSALNSGTSAWQAFQQAGSNALNKISDKLMNMAIDNLWSNAFGGKAGTGLLGSLFGAGKSGAAGELPGWGTSSFVGPVAANGRAFSGNSTIIPFANGGAFSNSIVNQPTLFKFASGTGMMGEAGPEAIIPLSRGPNGKLGVSAPGGGGGSVHIDASDNRVIHIGAGASTETVAALKQELAADRAMRKEQVIGIVAQARKERRL